MRHRRHARRNPTNATTIAILVGGAALLGVGAYLLLKPSTPASAPALPTASSGPGGSMIVYTDPQGKTYTRDYAAQIACQLKRIGQTQQSTFWAGLVTSNGGTLLC